MTRSDLDHLRLFASFGKMIIDQNPSANCCPFQHLTFAIRDWDLDDDLGLAAGSSLLQSVMEDCKESEEGAELVQSIKQSFQKISCSLLRHPGDQLRSEEFAGIELKTA